MRVEQTRTLEELRKSISSEVSERRYRHILGVEDTAARMAKLYADCFDRADDAEYTVRAAALLHDVTKDKGEEWYAAFIIEQSIEIPEDEKNSTELSHAHTAPAYISKVYPHFATSEILSATGKHTTGDADMSLTDKIICLADYIEQGRVHPACIELRKRFFSLDFGSADKEARLEHLDAVLLASLENTVSHLKTLGKAPAGRTLAAIDMLKEHAN